MNKRAILFCTLLSFLFFQCSGFLPSRQSEGFVTVKGSQFFHDGHPYYYAGANMWYGCYLGSSGRTGDRPRLVRELDSLSAMGLVNLRVLAASEDSYIKRSIKPAIQRSPGELDEDLLKGLDFLLSEMGKRHMQAVLYLNNYWEWSGGMAQYNVWANGGEGADPEDVSKGYSAFMLFSATFYTNERANKYYREYVRTLVQRRNTVNGLLYRDDPTIMTWELANEPRPGFGGPDESQHEVIFDQWVDETARYIHSLDPHHLVCTGSEGTIAFGFSTDRFRRSHDTKEIDYLTFHLWPKNWGWFNPMNYRETLPSSETKAMGYIADNLGVARALHKPIVMEEFGLARDSAKCLPGSPATARDEYYALVLNALYDSSRAGSPMVGSNLWTWGGEATPLHADDMWRIGDTFTGDPPQEPQGFNSICVGDTSTLRVIRAHASAMNRLGQQDSLPVVR